MLQGRFLFVLTCLSVLTAAAVTSLLAKGNNDSVWMTSREKIRIVHENAPFDIIKSTMFFNSTCLTSIECLSFPLINPDPTISLTPTPDHRNMEQKVADTFAAFTAYPGGTLVYKTLLAGLDLMDYSRRKTSFTYQNFKFGSNFGGAGRGFLKTGFNYDF